jgi:GAF domain-containing protein
MFRINLPGFFKDEQDRDPSFIRLVRNILIFVIVVNVVLLPLVTGIAGEDAENPPAFIALSVTLVFEIVSLYFALQGRMRIAKAVVPAALIVAATIIALNTNGLKNVAILGMPIILIVAAILLGRQALFFTTPLAVAGVVVVAVADLGGRIEYVPAGLDDAIIIPVLLVGSAGIIHLLILRLNESLERARASESAQRGKNAELEALRATLEERINRRAAELEAANQTLERRARRFEAIAQVLQAVSSIQNLDTLLPQVTRVISGQFNIYHTGIFLLDHRREFAVLRAANSPGGQNMLARGHKLKVGQTGIVGFVTATGQPRIALNVGMDAVFFNNPDLPETRSEMALPLRYAGQIIGALDVQSTEPNAFAQDDVETLSILADQVAIAINNARTLEEAQRSLTEAQSAIGTSTRETWKSIRPKSLGLGVQLRESTLTPLEKPLNEDHVREAVERGETVVTGGENEPPKIAVPIRLRGQVIGVMNLQTRGNYTLTKNDADVASAVAERLSLALETATLLQAAQQRASLERMTSDIASRIVASTRFESILQTAAQELSRALGGSDVLVQVEPLALESSGAEQEVK